MVFLKRIIAALLVLGILTGPLTSFAADSKSKAKPYPLKTCLVSDEKLGEMGDPYTFEHKGQQVKLCCKSCLKDFNKNPEKFLKKLESPKAKKK